MSDLLLRRLCDAADALWNAHCKSHDAHQHPERGINPLKYAMNYGELVELKKQTDQARALLRSEPPKFFVDMTGIVE